MEIATKRSCHCQAQCIIPLRKVSSHCRLVCTAVLELIQLLCKLFLSGNTTKHILDKNVFFLRYTYMYTSVYDPFEICCIIHLQCIGEIMN